MLAPSIWKSNLWLAFYSYQIKLIMFNQGPLSPYFESQQKAIWTKYISWHDNLLNITITSGITSHVHIFLYKVIFHKATIGGKKIENFPKRHRLQEQMKLSHLITWSFIGRLELRSFSSGVIFSSKFINEVLQRGKFTFIDQLKLLNEVYKVFEWSVEMRLLSQLNYLLKVLVINVCINSK